jgi:hypothetical protein
VLIRKSPAAVPAFGAGSVAKGIRGGPRALR